MKKSMLCAGLMSVLCVPTYAENNDKTLDKVITAMQATSNSQLETTSKEVENIQHHQLLASASQTVTPKSNNVQLPASQGQQVPTPQGQQVPTPQDSGQTTTQTTTSQGVSTTTTQGASGQTSPGATVNPQPQPTVNQSTTPTATPQPTTPNTATTVVTQPVTPPKPIDCNYHIPASTTKIDQALVMKWAEKATAQSFDFDYTTMDTQLAALKACYTDLGWQGFTDALQKSGNLNAIKSQQLMVSSMINGAGQISEVKDNQWKISLPLQVVYQNNKEKLTQSLTINLVIGRKISGDLGIMQMIAIPRTNTTPASSTSSTSATPAQTQ
ncbi:DotI/IcmL family type IV secretion protein [Legionella brunensis]|uniref:IcmL-like protein n=1 Tax=Legionella brunensis TaxID=29422 RepID=A0A0W0SSI8_9GAMM|nr:DotI/IcmL family type IV secretion protein [Legionella brunensis]KTC86320.1 IcmL-like protein [Legionella brunensis]